MITNLTYFITVSFLLTVCITSCNPLEEPCSACDFQQTHSAFKNKYFRFLLTPEGRRLILYDTISGSSLSYKICSPQLFQSVESRKILQGNGAFTKSCDQTEDIIRLDNFTVIETCLPPLPAVDGEFDLYGIWYIYSIHDTDTIVHPPCEGETSFISFNEDLKIEGNTSINPFSGNFTHVNSNTIVLSESIAIGLLIGTQNETFYESILNRIIVRGDTLTYSIQNNVMVLINPGNNSFIKLYKRP